MRKFKLLIVSVCTAGLGYITPSQAQASLQRIPVTLQSVEDTFLVQNYMLLAQRYQIDASKALVRQAKIWDNPEFSTVLGWGSTDQLKPFNIGSGGQAQYDIDQLIQLAGKRNKNIQLAGAAASMNEATFDELVRTLKLQLRENFYDIYYTQQTGLVLKEQLDNLQKIVDAYVEADKKGSVPHSDVVRLQALMVGLENDYADLKQEELNAQKNLQQLLHSQDFYEARLAPGDLAHYSLDHIQLQQLLDSAAQNRPDVRVAALQYQSAELNYRLQKSMAVPDLHVGATYDKAGSYINNFVGLKLGIDLPFWNRNQGNIRAAQYQVKSEAEQFKQQQSVAQTEVLNAYQRILALEKRYKSFDLQEFQQQFDTLIDEVAKNFRKGNISLLQFIDYFNSYSDNAKNINRFLSNRVNAYEELNYATGQELFK